MDDFHDDAGFDGDGEFDAIDLEIIEAENAGSGPEKQKTGCCLPMIFAAGLFAHLGVYII